MTAAGVPSDANGGGVDGGAVFSIGHGGQTESSLVEQLRLASVSFVVDVRSVPYSKHQPEFAREHVQVALQDAGIRYVFMGDALGGRPADPSCYTDGRVDYGKTRKTDFFQRGLARISSAYAQGLRVCLLCSEGQPDHCHRSKLIGVALAFNNIPVIHLLPDGSSLSQEDVMASLTNGQGNLFEEPLMSRRRYLSARSD